MLFLKKEDISKEALLEMKKTPPIGAYGPKCLELIDSLLCREDDFKVFTDEGHEKLVNKVLNQQFCLPSALHQRLQSGVEDLTVDTNFRNATVALFKKVMPNCP